MPVRHLRIALAAATGVLLLGACGAAAEPPATTLPAPAGDPAAPGADDPAVSGPAGPGATSDDDPAVSGDCAGASVDPSSPPADDLSGPVAELRARLIGLAQACDFEGLAEATGEDFTFSFGASEDPAAYWRDLEANGTPITAILIHLLDMDHAVEEGPEFTVWPAVFVLGEDASEAQWTQVEAIHTAEEIAGYRQDGYLGWRTGITADGEWQYLVAGD